MAPVPRCTDQEESDAPRAIDPLGTVALFMGCAALLCASVPWLCGLLLPASVLALVTGLAALVRAARSGRSQLLFPIAGTAVPAAVLGLALLLPDLLGPTYRASRERDALDPTAIRRLPLPGAPATSGADDPTWVDASRFAQVQGTLQIEVTQVSVERVELAGDPKGKGEPRLVVRLRIQQAPQTRDLAPNQKTTPGVLKLEHQPTLTDAAGTAYGLVHVKLTAAAAEGRGAAVFHVGLTTATFLFEAPLTDAGTLKLEVPAAPWGGSGVVRFALPNAMIQRKTGG
jgi:hypothetical protein